MWTFTVGTAKFTPSEQAGAKAGNAVTRASCVAGASVNVGCSIVEVAAIMVVVAVG